MKTIPIQPTAAAIDPAEALLAIGLKDLWYPICPSDFIAEKPISLRRLGKKIALWRDSNGTLHALEDHCPHRGAPLSQGVVLGVITTVLMVLMTLAILFFVFLVAVASR